MSDRVYQQLREHLAYLKLGAVAEHLATALEQAQTNQPSYTQFLADLLAVEVKATGEVRALHPEVEATLLRIAQEALANVAKHAEASRAGITLSYMEDVVTLDVRDDGAGFALANGSPASVGEQGESRANGGFGLIAMRQRVGRLAGQLEIESEPGAGAAVSATLPAIPLGESS